MNNYDPAPQKIGAMDAALRDACGRAQYAIFPLITMLKLYRSVVALSRALMRARIDAGESHDLGDELIALLDAARDAACAHFPDPDRPLMDAIAIHRAIVALAGVAHRARAGRRHERAVEEDTPPVPIESLDPTEIIAPIESIQPGEPESPLSVWRSDHKTDRDQKAHELLRTVVDERLFAKIRAANAHELEAREGQAQAGAA